ncbi:DELTA-stichotoxin-Hcr4a-like [Colossoma macropomum]|uniref:DELTA-stichotoxin-Hcr4a-like n=1 Tax=Colossoma macropomum TaxID=42526 RepID=UPI001863E875|nr:DELTA-stichotoxin-Hcr4a-like [Colossoma macropomum]
MNPATVAKVASAASAVFAGASLFGTGVEQISRRIDTSRNVTIQITNYSDEFTLTNPRTHNISGCCYHPPQPTIATKTQETCSFSKTSYAACGSVGVLTYQIRRNETDHVGELAIMFSVPYDYNVYENWFALGIFEANIPCDYDLFKKMYYDNVVDDGPFTRDKGAGGVITYSGKGALVKGTMSAFGQSIIKVELWDEDLAKDRTKTEQAN